MPPRKDKGFYMISVVAKRFEVHPQTLRLYEREGLLRPSRTRGNTRLYSDTDLEILSLILNLTRDLGVNLAGVEIILSMRHKLQTMQSEVDRFVTELKGELRKRRQRGETEPTEALVRVGPQGRIIKIEKG